MTLLEAIMNRDECSKTEAQSVINSMLEQIEDGEDPEEVLFNEGFELDYILDLLL